MKSFKLLTEEIEQFVKKSKQSRQEDIKEIKNMYKELEGKQENPFDNTEQRINKNLTFYRENNFKKCCENITLKDIVEKYMKKIQEYQSEISKMNEILEKGCGKVVVKAQGKIQTENKSELNL